MYEIVSIINEQEKKDGKVDNSARPQTRHGEVMEKVLELSKTPIFSITRKIRVMLKVCFVGER